MNITNNIATRIILLLIILIQPVNSFASSDKSANNNYIPIPISKDEDFQKWLAEFATRAAEDEELKHHYIKAAIDGISLNSRIFKFDKNQPESKQTFQDYLQQRVSGSRVTGGQELYHKHREQIQPITKQYNVQARFIVALWGMESFYGRITGNTPIPNALASLAWEGRRASFFERELIALLKIAQQNNVPPQEINEFFKGSWAGAMGQTQFMPTSYLALAQDGDNDGKKDIWNNHADIWSSIARYLERYKWDPDTTWGRKVSLKQANKAEIIKMAGLDYKHPLKFWQEQGVRKENGNNLPNRPELQASLIIPDENNPDLAFLIYDNYRILLRWNRSHLFALSVGILSDKINQY